MKYSSLAQQVEHAAVNRRVVGSSPTGGAKSKQSEHRKCSDCLLIKILLDYQKNPFLTKIIVDILFIFAYNNNAGRNTLYTHATEFAFKRHVMASAMGPP